MTLDAADARNAGRCQVMRKCGRAGSRRLAALCRLYTPATISSRNLPEVACANRRPASTLPPGVDATCRPGPGSRRSRPRGGDIVMSLPVIRTGPTSPLVDGVIAGVGSYPRPRTVDVAAMGLSVIFDAHVPHESALVWLPSSPALSSRTALARWSAIPTKCQRQRLAGWTRCEPPARGLPICIFFTYRPACRLALGIRADFGPVEDRGDAGVA
jgi:hypothetical protein